MANDSHLFRTEQELSTPNTFRLGNRLRCQDGDYVPLYEAKLVHHYDHRFATYAGATQANLNKGTLPQVSDADHRDAAFVIKPEYWVHESHVDESVGGRWNRRWFFGFRGIARATDNRTFIAAIIPAVAVSGKFPLVMTASDVENIVGLLSSTCSFVFDFACRTKVGGSDLALFIVKQLPVLAPEVYGRDTAWSTGTLRAWLSARVVELTYTAWDLEPFGTDIGYTGPPYRWDPERRFLLRCELDAAFFHLYGLSRDDTDYIMDTFPIVRKNDLKAHKEYRTKRVILEIYDAMAEAASTGRPYQTRLDPPPANPGVAHPESTRPPWAQKP